MNFLFCGYRDWSLKIIDDLENRFSSDSFFIAKSRRQLSQYARSSIEFDIVMFVGWSWIINNSFLEKNTCICVHPSPLPKYRGGSPMQNQILSGEKESKVTVFLMNSELDAGPIISQSDSFSLSGNLKDVFDRVSTETLSTLCDAIEKKKNNRFVGLDQNESDATFFKRRKPEQSEIVSVDFSNYTAEQMYDKIRCLQNPYPNAFIVCADGKRLYLTGARIDD